VTSAGHRKGARPVADGIDRQIQMAVSAAQPTDSAAAAQVAPLLEITGLTKHFTGTLALDQVDFSVRRGEVHALLGQNGAGKSTLIKILAGVYPSDRGEIRYDGVAVTPGSHRLPIAFIHQDLGLVDSMTVAENVAILAGYPRRFGLISWQGVAAASLRALRLMGSHIEPQMLAAGLTAAEKSIVAIARALAVHADILVLDEPTAALPEADVAHLLDALDRLRKSGIGIIYVSHRLDEVFRIADRVTVLRDGRNVRTAAIQDITPDDLVFDIVGRALERSFEPPALTAGESALKVENLTVGEIGPVSFHLRQGEILGLVGLRGAGHHAVGRAIFGAIPRDGGNVTLDGKRLDPSGPEDAMLAGVGFVSSKRAEESLAANMAVRENLHLNATITGHPLLRLMNPEAERAAVEALIRRFSIRPDDPERPVATLSGGNQQKVVVARWLEAKVRLLVLEEPTIGVDVGSKAEIYALLQQALLGGMAVLLISSDFEEIERICHRALVFDRGRIGAEVQRQDLSVPLLTLLASGKAAPATGAAAS
jgi:ribose transport system ATP-binding protein